MVECQEPSYFFFGFLMACVMGGIWVIVEGCKEAERMKQRRKAELTSED